MGPFRPVNHRRLLVTAVLKVVGLRDNLFAFGGLPLQGPEPVELDGSREEQLVEEVVDAHLERHVPAQRPVGPVGWERVGAD